MTEKRYLKNYTNDGIKIILYVVFMTTLFIFYCSNENYEIVKSIDYFNSTNKETIKSSYNNGN